MKIEIIDNFLSSYHADSYERLIGDSSNELPLFYYDDLNENYYLGNYYFVNALVNDYHSTKFGNDYFHSFLPFLSKFNLTTSNKTQYNLQRLYRLKVNLYPRTHRMVHHEPHTDYEPNLGLRTCLYYVNTNNGFTIFDGKRKIRSKKNRAIIFDGSIKHHSTTPTNCNWRGSINIDFKI